MNIGNLFKNKLHRILTKKEVIIVAVIIIPIMITAAVLFAGREETKSTVAWVTAGNADAIPQNDKYDIKVLKEKPEISNLLLGHYDFIYEEKRNGQHEVETVIKSKADKEELENFITKHSPLVGKPPERERGGGTKILGFVVMILIMQAVAITLLYPEDRTLKTLRRIFAAPVNKTQYIFTQGLFTFICLYVPTFLAVVMTRELFGVKMGFSLGMLAFLVGLLTALSTAFALFISSVLRENISLTASGIALVTSLLAGCFNSFTVSNNVLNWILDIIPLRAFMSLSEGIENGNGIFNYKGQILYLLAWTIVMALAGSMIAARKMSKGID
ncbi:MDR ABC transporter permease [Paenibacillus dendritiformis]|nr:MDR ABC transporter permease [Paenibacillus dendritiformis]